jgi:hypothetical protein
MAETPTKVPVRTGGTSTATTPFGWRPFESLRRDIDRLFEDFAGGSGARHSRAPSSISQPSGEANRVGLQPPLLM